LIKKIIYTIAVFFIHSIANAQQYYLKGDVKDEAGKPLQNVSILQSTTGYLIIAARMVLSDWFLIKKKIL